MSWKTFQQSETSLSSVAQSCSTLCDPMDCSMPGLPASAAAAKSLQSCPTLCDPINGSPPGSPVPGILQARTLEWVAMPFSNAWKWKVKGKKTQKPRPSLVSQFNCSVVSDSLRPHGCSTPGLPVHRQLPESTQTHVHWVGDAIQPSHPLSPPSLPAFNLSQHQGLFKWVGSSNQLAKVLEF